MIGASDKFERAMWFSGTDPSNVIGKQTSYVRPAVSWADAEMLTELMVQCVPEIYEGRVQGATAARMHRLICVGRQAILMHFEQGELTQAMTIEGNADQIVIVSCTPHQLRPRDPFIQFLMKELERDEFYVSIRICLPFERIHDATVRNLMDMGFSIIEKREVEDEGERTEVLIIGYRQPVCSE